MGGQSVAMDQLLVILLAASVAAQVIGFFSDKRVMGNIGFCCQETSIGLANIYS